MRTLRTLYKWQLRGGLGLCSTLYSQDNSKQMIVIFVILAWHIFADLMFASKVSRRANRCSQVYATDFGWARTFPMAFRSETQETLLFARDGVLPACICDSSKEMIQGKFYQKLHDAALSWNSWSHILHDQMLQKERLKRSRKMGCNDFTWEGSG